MNKADASKSRAASTSRGGFPDDFKRDDEISRGFHFTVGSDGEIVRQPFPGMKAIHTVGGSYSLKMEYKDNPDLEFDADAFRKGKLYGRE